MALKADGKYADAYDQFAQAAALYPLDRVVRNQMGRMLFLQRKYSEALAQYQRTMTVDPEDLEAHYNMMLCYRGLNNDELASREEKLYLRFKADESARSITGPYKLAHAEDNNEAQPIHEHEWARRSRPKAGSRNQKPGCCSADLQVGTARDAYTKMPTSEGRARRCPYAEAHRPSEDNSANHG